MVGSAIGITVLVLAVMGGLGWYVRRRRMQGAALKEYVAQRTEYVGLEMDLANETR